MKLSKHFTLAEAGRSQTADRRGIDNEPPKEYIPKLQTMAHEILEPIRLHFMRPFSPSSWYRSLELNRAIGSKDNSQHVKAEACDIEIPGVPNVELARWINYNLDFDQLLLEFYREGEPSSGWVHVSYVSPEENRKQVLTIGRSGTKEGLPS